MAFTSEHLLEQIKSLPDGKQALIHQKITDHLYHQRLQETLVLERQQSTKTATTVKDIPLMPPQISSIGDLPEEQLTKYVISFLYHVPNDIEVKVFEKAVRYLVNRHTGLRTYFIKQTDRWIQNCKNTPHDDVFVHIKFESVDEIDDQATLQSIIQQPKYNPRLEEGPLFQVFIIALERQYLLIRANHLIYDYVSNQIVVEELMTIYQHLIDENTEGYPLLSRPTQFHEFSRAVHDITHSPKYETALSYWKNLDINRYTQLPLNATQNYSSTTYNDDDFYRRIIEIPANTIDIIHKFQQYKLTDWLLAALGLCLNEWSGTRAWLIRLSHHGRIWRDIDLSLSNVVGSVACSRIFGLTLDPDNDSASSLIELTHHNLQQLPPEGGLFWALYDDSVKTSHREQLLALYRMSEISFNMVADSNMVQHDIIQPANINIANPFSFTREKRKMVISAKLAETKALSMFWLFDLAFFEKSVADYLCDNYIKHLNSLIKTHLAS